MTGEEMFNQMNRINEILQKQKTGFQIKACKEDGMLKFIAYETSPDEVPYRIASDVTPMKTLRKLALNTGYEYQGEEHDPILEALIKDRYNKQNKRG